MPKKKQEETPLLSAKEIARYKDAFNKVDKKKTGSIPVKKINEVLVNAKEDIHEEDIQDALDEMGKSNNDDITVDEFIQLINLANDPQAIIDAFQLFDKDKNGFISIDEFKCILELVQTNFNQEEVKEIFDMTDVNKDGKIDYREFVTFWNNQ